MRQGQLVGPVFSSLGVCCCLWAWYRYRKHGALSSRRAPPRQVVKKIKRRLPQRVKMAMPSENEDVGNTDSPANDTAAAAAGADSEAGVAFFSFVFYEVGFHSLSNLPLENPLLFGIHARFWMQPNVLLFVWVGIGLIFVSEWILQQATSVRSTLQVPLLAAIVIGLVGGQVWRWFPMMDQSDNRYLEGYARGILESLPPKSLFFTNYDQQWTASRYLHVCEGVRKDVPFINLSMMTFWWFYRQRELFPDIAWPSAYLAGSHTKQYARGEAFTFKELLDANIDRFPGGIYLGGDVASGAEGGYREHYDSIPFGMVSRLVRKTNANKQAALSADSVHKFENWLNASDRAWATVHAALPSLPSVEKYDEETWEWTVGKDYWDHRRDTASYKLYLVTGGPLSC